MTNGLLLLGCFLLICVPGNILKIFGLMGILSFPFAWAIYGVLLTEAGGLHGTQVMLGDTDKLRADNIHLVDLEYNNYLPIHVSAGPWRLTKL